MLYEALTGAGLFVGYYAVAASLLLLIRWLLKPPGEVFRKLLHIACIGSIFVLLYAFDRWYLAAGCALVFALVVYPLIALLERVPRAMALLVERQRGEIKRSLMLVFVMMAALIALFWGLLGPQWKFVVIASVMGWGTGDAAAALVGKYLGTHSLTWRRADGHKTVEGSLAMLAVSFAAILTTLLCATPMAWSAAVPIALFCAVIAMVTEMVSRGGNDTITVPLAVAAPLFLLTLLLGGVA